MNINSMAERKGRKGHAKGAKEFNESSCGLFLCVFCESFAPFAFGILEVVG
jgi:hypothetical protein